ncbi:CinA family protein [Chitinophagaceae bacterium MMS25-I14]
MYALDKINAIKDALLDKHQTIAVAESVTSGHLQAALSLADNATLFFQGGITVYNLGQKARHLHIEPIAAEACNCVSPRIASQMARQVTDYFSSSIGIAITGYAAPVPEKDIHKLFAFYAISTGVKIINSGMIEAATEEPLKVQLFYTDRVLDRIMETINNLS